MAGAGDEGRAARLRAALRDNLRRRKTQARRRGEGSGAVPDAAGEGGPAPDAAEGEVRGDATARERS